MNWGYGGEPYEQWNPPNAHVPPYAGGKVQGVFQEPKNAPLSLTSGKMGPSMQVRGKGINGFNGNQLMHVEGHVAAQMRVNKIQSGVLDINKVPCVKGQGGGCEGLLPRMLPPGSKLRVRGPGGYDRNIRRIAGSIGENNGPNS